MEWVWLLKFFVAERMRWFSVLFLAYWVFLLDIRRFVVLLHSRYGC